MRFCTLLGLAIVLTSGASAARADDLSGRWRGTWNDAKSGHTGPLRAAVRPTRDGDYRARFTGRFAGVVPFWFGAKLHVVGETEDGRTMMQGAKNLGPFGSFRYSAVSDGRTFEADYSARRWYGRFRMAR